MVSVEDFINVPMDSLSFLCEDIESNETIVIEDEKDPLDLNRLLDNNDSYDEIMFHDDKEIRLKNGEYVLARPSLKEEGV